MKLLLLIVVLLFPLSDLAAENRNVLHIASVADNLHAVHVENILTGVYQKIGYEVIFHPLPSKRAIADAASGKLDGEIARIDGLSKTYPDLIKVPTPIIYLKAYAYSLKPLDGNISTWSDLKDYRIGIKRGVLFAEKGTKGMDVYKVDTADDLFRLLKAERVDVVIENQFIAKLTLKGNSDFLPIKQVGEALLNKPLFHYLHVSKEHVVPLLDSEFQRRLE